MDRVYVFDTTLRDGEQSPGVSLNVKEKIEIARQLARLGVDVIEVGFPVASPGDFNACREVARAVRGVTVCALARARQEDIDRAWEAIKEAEAPRIHTFIATSDIHLRHKLRMTREQVLEATRAAVAYSKRYAADVEFSAEDASRSDPDFLCQVLAEAIAAGATVLNIPDTVGYAVPEEFGELIRVIRERTPGIEKVILSCHCHNDLGLAVANTLAAVRNGVRQVEVTINGIGERAGNAALEEVVMALYAHRSGYGLVTGIRTEELYRTSKLVSTLTGMPVQPNKAIVGKNAFAHESGIHQDGVLKERSTYEIIDPAIIGVPRSRLVLGKHSGRHAFRVRLQELGYELTEEELNAAFQRFKELCDRKKEITDDDLLALVEEEIGQAPSIYELRYFHISSGTTVVPTATVALRIGDELREEAACGNGPVDAIYKAVDKLTGRHLRLDSYSIEAVTEGKDAIGSVTVRVTDEERNKTYLGRGISTDVLEASARAYVDALNKLAADLNGNRVRRLEGEV
ncbi:2-isopropylmalate synthase [Desulfothermobacter acidiphilus]|uniref:2-isopropylmalate synthase n=1 Tax=Desulfothermobacter acidiphilus TaxID=1938353 RepID=UPI003F8876BF